MSHVISEELKGCSLNLHNMTSERARMLDSLALWRVLFSNL